MKLAVKLPNDMAEPSPDVFRKILKEFKKADALFSSEPKRVEKEYASEQGKITKLEETAKRVLAGCKQLSQGKRVASNDLPEVKITPQIDVQLQRLKNQCTEIEKNQQRVNMINVRLRTLEKELTEALIMERRWHRSAKIKRVIGAVTVLCLLIVLHFELLPGTTLSFNLVLDGKPSLNESMPKITIDWLPFTSGNRITPGRHLLTVEADNIEPMQRSFWAFYGSNSLGVLPILSLKGGVSLISDPPDAEFDLSGNGQHWQGELPTHIDAAPTGVYQLTVRRRGWELDQNVKVSRGTTVTNKTEFPYCSIEVTSEPAGLMFSLDGAEAGKTPATLHELKPGQYKLSISDGENDLTADVSAAAKEAVKHSFVFHYGAVQLSSTPIGATVSRNGKEIGKTPLTLNHIPVGDTMVELRMPDFVPTNVLVKVVEGVTINLSAKLISENYSQAMKQARESFDASHYTDSQKFLSVALKSEPNDPAAMELGDKVSQAVAKAEEASRVEQANAKAQTLASLTWLNFQGVISDCTDAKQVQYPVSFDDGYYDNNGKFHKTGQHTEMRTRIEHTFNPITFSERYRGRTFGFNCPDKWCVSKVGKDGSVMLKQARGLLGSDNISVIAPASNPDALRSLQKGQKVTIKGVLTKCESGVFAQTLYLEDSEILDK